MNAPIQIRPATTRSSASRIKVSKPVISPEDLGPVEKIRLAFHRRSRVAACFGLVFGGIVPLATYNQAHVEIDRALPLQGQVAAYLALGGLIFSALTIFEWGRRTFGNPVKACAFAVLLEGVMLTSHQTWLAWLVLALLIFVNAVALACNVALPAAGKIPRLQAVE